MRTYGGLSIEEANEAAWEAGRGAVVGAARWGIYTAILGGVGFAMSPVYRGLTLQFKVFLQMSGMVTGGMLDADSRLRAYELRVRMQRKIANDRANREHYEREYDEPEYRPPPKNDK